jgi:hypothetical protein
MNKDIMKRSSEHRSSRMLVAVTKYLTGDISISKLQYLTVYFAVISSLELSAYLFRGIFSVIASRVWSLTGVICFITILIYFIKVIIQDLKEEKYLAFLSVIVLTSALVYLIGNLNLTEINPDATQQAAAGLDSFRYGDWNYTGKAFLGYPNRQYIITALPALLFGRSIFTLQLGFAFPFILGMLLLYCAIRSWAHNLHLDTNLVVLPLYAFFVFPFITEYYTNFEQAI